MRRIYTIIGILVVIAGVVALVVMFTPLLRGSSEPATQKITDQKKIGALALAFVAPPYADQYQALRVSGYVDNLSTTQTLVRTSVEINLYDRDGNRKEVVKQTLKDIPPRQRKSYDVSAGTFKDARDARIKVVSVEVEK